MPKTWNIVIEGENGNALSFTGIDAMDIIGVLTLNSMYIASLKLNIEKRSQYKVIGRVKSLESSTGDKPDVKTSGIALATAVGDNVEMGFFFMKVPKERVQIIALWSDEFAKACKGKPDLCKRFIVSLVSRPATFANVSIVLPMM